MNLHLQHHLGAWKCKFSGPTLDLLYQNLWNEPGDLINLWLQWILVAVPGRLVAMSGGCYLLWYSGLPLEWLLLGEHGF